MIRRWGALLAFAAAFACARTASAGDDSWTPDDFEKPEPGAPSSRPEREPPEPVDPENVPRRELEPRAAPFGARGQVAVFGGTSFGLSYLTYESGAEETSGSVAPSLLYFPVSHLAVGIGAHLSYDDSKYFTPSDFTDTETFHFLAGPKLGYDVPLSRGVSLFPIASLLLGYASVKQEVLVPAHPTGAARTPITHTGTDASLELALPVLFHPVQNFSIGFGPRVYHDFSANQGQPDIGAQATTVGLALYLVGHSGGELPPEEAHAAPPRKYDSHLGSAGTFVLVNDLNLAGSFTHFPVSKGDQTTFTIGGTVLHFFGDRVALGGGALVGATHATNAPATDGRSFDATTVTLAGYASTGYAAPIGGGVVFFPRATLSFGVDDRILSSSGTSNARTEGFIGVGAFTPLDIELAPHFFAGLGPYVRRDLFRFEQAGAPQNISTTVGAGLEIGTWL